MPKMKDMLVYSKNDHTKVSVFRVYYAPLSSTLSAADGPSQYITRITHLIDTSDVDSSSSITFLVLVYTVSEATSIKAEDPYV